MEKRRKIRRGKGSGTGHRKDDARPVAIASDGEFNTAQVRILRALRDACAAGRAMTRRELKDAVGNSHKRGYNIKWVGFLMSLYPKFMSISQHEPMDGKPPRHLYYITKDGLAHLLAAEELAMLNSDGVGT